MMALITPENQVLIKDIGPQPTIEFPLPPPFPVPITCMRTNGNLLKAKKKIKIVIYRSPS